MTLLELLHLLRAKLGLVITLPVVFALVTAIVCYGFLPNEYTASVSMYILANASTESSGQTADAGSDYSALTAAQLLANDFATLAESDLVANKTAKALKMDSLDGYKISVTSSTTTRVITLSVTGENPSIAAAVANQMAEELSSTAVDIMNVQSVNVIDAAQVPKEPSGPPRSLYTVVALLAGLFVAVALVVLLDMLDTRVKDAEDAEETFGLPVLGQMPRIKG